MNSIFSLLVCLHLLGFQSYAGDQASGVGVVPWKTVGGSWWYGNVSIGNPPQQFQFKFSLMERDLLVYNKNVTIERDGTHLENRTRQFYDSNISSTYLPDGQYFCQGSASDPSQCESIFAAIGVRGKDTLDLSQLEMPNLEIGLIDTADADFDPGVKDGIFGLQIGQTANGLPSALEQAMPNLAKPIYTIYSNNHNSVHSFSGTGEFTFGAEDERHCNAGEYQYVPVDMLLNYYIPGSRLHSITFGNKTWPINKNIYFGLTASAFEGNVEVSTNFIAGNEAILNPIASEFDAILDETNSNYIVPCNSTFPDNLVLKLGQTESMDFVIKPSEYILTRHDGRCTLILQARVCDNCAWLTGSDFIYSRCNAHKFGGNKQMLGFAPVVRRKKQN